jgi:hypothetical protein
MIVSCGSKGEPGPKSITNPVFLCVDFHATGVPCFTQKNAFALGFAMLAVAVAEFAVRFTSTVHGSEADPHVFSALQRLAGFASAQAYLPFCCAIATSVRKAALNSTNVKQATKQRRFFMGSSLRDGRWYA